VSNQENLPELHVSDIGTFRNCRWRWDWSSNLRQNLERDVPVPHFLLGRAVHYALAQYYEGFDALEAYERFVEHDVRLSEHLQMLEDMDLRTKIVDSIVTGRGMVAHYVAWAPRHDKDWEVLSTEKTGRLPRDGFVYGGRYDGVWRNKTSGKLWLAEFKTTRSMQEIAFIYKDPQPMLYLMEAEHEFHVRLEGVLYTFLWKKVPEMPKRLQNGTFSKSKSQATTASLYIEALRKDAKALSSGDPQEYDRLMQYRMAEYAEVLTYLAGQEDQYFRRIPLEKTRYELEQNLAYLDMTVREMLDPNVALYPSPSQVKCPRCPFKDPCDVRHLGGNYQLLIAEEYRKRVGWQEELLFEEEQHAV
jgi:hypothetical protein